MKHTFLVSLVLAASACGGSGGGSNDGGGTPFVMESILVGSCHTNAGEADEGCTAWRYNTKEDVDIRAYIESGCVASGDSYSTGQCGPATYGCCKYVNPNDVQGNWTAMYGCGIGDANAPTATWNLPEACALAGGVWSAGPPGL